MADAGAPEIGEDALLGGRIRLLQASGGHRAGTDAVLLAQTADLRAGDRVVDLGSGSGAVGLMLAARGLAAAVMLVERESEPAALARRNVSLNGLDGTVTVVEADIFGGPRERRAAGLAAGTADLVVTNPPFAEPHARASPDPGRRAAHVMQGGGLPDWIAAAADLLRPRGRLHMIHRADRLGDCLAALAPCFGSIRIVPVLPKAGRDAVRVLIAAVRGGRAPLALAAPLVLMDEAGRFTAEAASLHRSGAGRAPDAAPPPAGFAGQ